MNSLLLIEKSMKKILWIFKISLSLHPSIPFDSGFWAKLNATFEVRIFADVVKLVDTLDLGSSAERYAGSSPSIRTIMVSFRGHFLFNNLMF